MSQVQLTIIGLGQIGTSIGLCLAKSASQIHRVGHDKSSELLRQAQKMGAIDHFQSNLHTAVENADVIVLAVPVDNVQSTLQAILPDLKSGVVVLDCSPINKAILEWAGQSFQPERYFLKFIPTLNPIYLLDTVVGIQAAHADEFHNGVIYICSPGGTHPDALKLAVDMTTLLGAKALFSDPLEVDGLLAAQHLLPQLMSAALVNATIEEPGWIEGRKIAGSAYTTVSEPLLHLDEVEILGLSAIMNKDNAARVLDNLISALVDLREVITEGDQAALHALLSHAVVGRQNWWEQRNKADWSVEAPMPSIPSSGQWVGRLVGIPSQRKADKTDKK
jgi:prephenate dehydrogenase